MKTANKSLVRSVRATQTKAAKRRRLPRLEVERLEDRTCLSTMYGLTPNNAILRFDSNTPGTIQAGVAVTGLQTGAERAIGIDFRPRTGQLYLTTVPVGVVANALLRTYSINLLTGAATLVGSIPNTVPGAADVATGYDFNPTVDRIRVVNANNENFRINPNNGSLAGEDTNLTFSSPATGPITAVAYDRNFDRANATTIKTTLYGIDTGASLLVVQGGIDGTPSPNGGTIASVGPLGVTVDVGSDAGFNIIPAAGQPVGTGYASLQVTGLTGLYRINLSSGAATLVGSIGNGATSVTSLTTVPDSVVAIGSSAGVPSDARLLDGFTGQIKIAVQPFAGYLGGVRVASADVTGDGLPDLIVGAARGAPGGHVKVFDGVSGAERYSFFAFDGYIGGVNVSGGDVDGDGFDDIIVGADAGANGGHVKAFSGKDGTQLASFFSFSGWFGGIRVAAADINLDGRAEIISAAGANGHVKVFDSTGAQFSSGSFTGSFFTFAGFIGRISVAAGDVNGDGIPDIIVGAGPGGAGGHVKAFSGRDNSLLDSFFAYEQSFTGGVNVGVSDFNRDGRFEIRTARGFGRASEISSYDGVTQAMVDNFVGFSDYLGGTSLGGARAS